MVVKTIIWNILCPRALYPKTSYILWALARSMEAYREIAKALETKAETELVTVPAPSFTDWKIMGKLPIAINYLFCFSSLSSLLKLKLLWESQVDPFSPDSKLKAVVEAMHLSTQPPATFIGPGMGTWSISN